MVESLTFKTLHSEGIADCSDFTFTNTSDTFGLWLCHISYLRVHAFVLTSTVLVPPSHFFSLYIKFILYCIEVINFITAEYTLCFLLLLFFTSPSSVVIKMPHIG